MHLSRSKNLGEGGPKRGGSKCKRGGISRTGLRVLNFSELSRRWEAKEKGVHVQRKGKLLAGVGEKQTNFGPGL